jgi:hypothetical protein
MQQNSLPANGQESKPWAGYFQELVTTIDRTSRAELEAVTRENWPATQALWREQLFEMLGLSPLPPRSDLKMTVVGSLTLEGVRIDRLHYQSRPGLYVAANLYTPTVEPPEGGWPAVLYVCGHARVAEHGRLMGNKTGYQHHGLWFARHNVVCLIIDTVQLGEFHGEHHGTYKLGRWDWITRGYTPAGVEAWNAIRGLDLLQSLPYVDDSKLGVTGRSGGGAYSWFAAALDERIQAAVPVAGITDLQNHVIDGCVEGHCDCMYFVNYYRWDYAKLAALMAPRALLLANTDTDSIFPLDGVMRIHTQMASLYRRLGAQDKYGVIITPGPHKDTQELQVGAFKWLLKHLTGSDPIIDSAALKEVSPNELAVFSEELPLQEKVTSAANWFVAAAKPRDSETPAGEQWKSKWLPALQRLGVLPPPDWKGAQFEPVEQGDAGGTSWQLWNAPNGAQILRIRKQLALAQDAPWMVHAGVADTWEWNASSIPRVQSDPGFKSLLDTFPDREHYFVRWCGAHWPASTTSVKAENQLVRRYYLVGRSPEQQAVEDLIGAVAWIVSQDPGQRKIEITGADRWAPLATLAALWHQTQTVGQAPGGVISALHVRRYPLEPLVAPCLPGLLRVCRFEDLRAAAEALFKVEEFEDSSPVQPLLVDTSREPQQANGMRIVEVGADRAQVWMRATRWPLPNLGDLPEVEFSKKDPANSDRGTRPTLPSLGVDGLRFAVPGVPAEVRSSHRRLPGGEWIVGPWTEVSAETDYSALAPLENLRPATNYEVRTQVRAPATEQVGSTVTGTFRTLPAETELAHFKLAVGTCQGFPDRDGPHGFDLYRTMLERETDAFVMAGDVVYYDALARNNALAYYHWQRTYSLPTLIEFHRQIPTFFLKDDHDTYVNDSWPGDQRPWTGEFSFEDGQRIFVQQTGLPTPAYRTIQVGNDLQLWFMEGRDFRSPNNTPDTADKSIWGSQQKAWLKETLAASTAQFRIVISPTPIVGPDRDNKSDNHSNRVFATEGREIRQFLASQPNTVAVCGDRHWQYHSVDPETGLHEFSVGPASDRHAGGWKQEDYRPDMHRYLRVAGGYLEIELSGESGSRELVLRHLDTRGAEHHSHMLR